MHLCERAIRNLVRKQILRTLEQVDVFLRHGEQNLVAIGRHQRWFILAGLRGTSGRLQRLLFGICHGVAATIGPVLRAVSWGEFAHCGGERLYEVTPARRARNGDTNVFGAEQLDAIGDGGLGGKRADHTQDLTLGAMFCQRQEVAVV